MKSNMNNQTERNPPESVRRESALLSAIVADMRESLDDILSINYVHADTAVAMSHFVNSNRAQLEAMFKHWESVTFKQDKYVFNAERRGRDLKIYIINNALGYIDIGVSGRAGFNSQALRPFSPITQHGLNYLEITKDGNSMRAVLVRYSPSKNVKLRDTEYGENPLSYGNAMHHIDDVFNIVQKKVYNTDPHKLTIITEDDVKPGDPDQLIDNVVRAGVYMLTTQLQTRNQSDSIFLNPSDFNDDQQSFHRRMNAFYTSNPHDDTIMFVNFRSQLTFKDRVNRVSMTSCNNLGACFAINKNETGMQRIDKLKYIGVHSSIGCVIDL